MNFPPTVVDGLFDQVLDGIPIGVITCTPSGLVLTTNTAAELILSAEDGLSNDGWLRASECAIALSDALAAAGNGEASSLVIERPSGRLGYQVRLIPLGRERSVVVYLTNPAAMPRPHWSTLVDAYALTPSEAEIASALADGRDLRQIAEERGVGIDTCRKQLRAIFDKVGVRRQVDLIRLLSGGAVACGPPGDG